MPGVFLSHSSADKRLVLRLVADLTVRGIPVWFDSWELETGDSLHERIFQGIDESTFLLVALSPNSIASRWVRKELTAALAREDKLRRKVILPVKIAPCDAPRSIADRLYVDFTKGYLQGLETLELFLRRHGVNTTLVPVEQQIIPLFFSKGLDIERVGLQKQFGELLERLRSGSTLVSSQIVPVPDDSIDQMREELRKLIENLAEHPAYSPDLDFRFRTSYEEVRKLEEALPAGVASIGNGMVKIGKWEHFAEAAYWYARMIRSEMLARLFRSWQFVRSDDPPLGKNAIENVIGTSDHAAKFWSVEAVSGWALRARGLKVWLDSRFLGLKEIEIYPGSPLWGEPMYKFLIPQIVANQSFYRPSKAFDWGSYWGTIRPLPDLQC